MSSFQVCEPVNIVNCRKTDVFEFTQAKQNNKNKIYYIFENTSRETTRNTVFLSSLTMALLFYGKFFNII